MVNWLKHLLNLFAKRFRSEKMNTCKCGGKCHSEEYTIRQKGTYARQLIANPLFNIIFDDLRADAIEKWENAPARDVDGKEMLWNYVKILGQVQARVNGYIAEAAIENDIEKHKEEVQPTL